MKLFDYKETSRELMQCHTHFYVTNGTIKVKTGIWPFQKIVTRPVRLKGTELFWYFSDTGQRTPGCQMEDIARVHY